MHKRAQVAARLGERGGELGRLGFVTSRGGMRKLRDWLVADDGGAAVVGVESRAGYGRLLVASLAAAGHELLNLSGWRTDQEGSAAATGPARATPATRSPSRSW